MYKGNKVKTTRVEGKTKQNKKKELSAKIPMTCPAGRMQSRTGYTAQLQLLKHSLTTYLYSRTKLYAYIHTTLDARHVNMPHFQTGTLTQVITSSCSLDQELWASLCAKTKGVWSYWDTTYIIPLSHLLTTGRILKSPQQNSKEEYGFAGTAIAFRGKWQF